MPRGSLGRGILAFAATMLAGVALTAPTAGAAPAQPFIIGGTNATQTYSFMASMQSTDGQHHCGASLVDKQWLVTAAHCVDGQQPSNVQYRIGTTDRTSGGELVKPDKFVAHPESKKKQPGYDIAMVHLSQPVQAQPIKIPATSPQPGTALRLLGWGQTCATPRCGEPPRTLQELDTKTVEPAKCTSSENPFDPARELCIDNKGGKASACYGDSGGPAVVREGSGFALVGATSRGQAENCPDKPGIYSNVVAHTDWINKTMSAGGSSEPPGGSPGRLPGIPPVTLPDMPPGMPPFPPGMPPNWGPIAYDGTLNG
jgi:secreted trypsin-like serine protease